MRFRIAKAEASGDLYAKYVEAQNLWIIQTEAGETINSLPEENFADEYIIIGRERTGGKK